MIVAVRTTYAIQTMEHGIVESSSSSPSGQDGEANLLKFSPTEMRAKSPTSTRSSSSPDSDRGSNNDSQQSSSIPSKPVTPHLSDSGSDLSEMMTEPPVLEEEPQVTLIGTHLKSVTFNVPATQQNKLAERERELTELEARLADKEQELEMRERELELKSEEWLRQYEVKKKELMDLESRVKSREQPSFTGKDVRISLENDNASGAATTNPPESIKRKSLARPRTIDEEETENSPRAAQRDNYDDDEFEIKTPPRSFSRPSIGQWSTERRRNNMSVKSMISNFEKSIKRPPTK